MIFFKNLVLTPKSGQYGVIVKIELAWLILELSEFFKNLIGKAVLVKTIRINHFY